MSRDLGTEWRKVMYKGIDSDSRIASSITKRDREQDSGYELYTKKGLGNYCYCISCSKSSGVALKDTTSIIYLCDDCFFKFGGLPLQMVPQEELDELVADLSPDKISNIRLK